MLMFAKDSDRRQQSMTRQKWGEADGGTIESHVFFSFNQFDQPFSLAHEARSHCNCNFACTTAITTSTTTKHPLLLPDLNLSPPLPATSWSSSSSCSCVVWMFYSSLRIGYGWWAGIRVWWLGGGRGGGQEKSISGCPLALI